MDKLNVISFRKKISYLKSVLLTLSNTRLKVTEINDDRLVPKLTTDQTDVNLFVFDDPSKYTGSTYHTITEVVKCIARYDAPVLIEGETGTGKENVARSIHHLSCRSDHNFVPLNCGAIHDNVLETELFGHEKGAFTDAKTRQEGLIGIANGGTLFLDEVDCLSPKVQVSLLRFLQTQEYRPNSSNRTSQSDIRVLAATNANLQHKITHHLFREDLYFRLNVLNINLPALRERTSDIPFIADKLIADFAAQYRLPPKQLSARTIEYLMKHPWPGNERELERQSLRSESRQTIRNSNHLVRHFLIHIFSNTTNPQPDL